MISEKIGSQVEVAAFMSLVRSKMLNQECRLELGVRGGRMKRVEFGAKEVRSRSAASQTGLIPGIAFYEALLNTGSAGVVISRSEARDLFYRALERARCGPLGQTGHVVRVSCCIPAVSYSMHIVLTGGHGVRDGDHVREQAMSICFLSLDRVSAAKFRRSGQIEINEKATTELSNFCNDASSIYRDGMEVVGVFDADNCDAFEDKIELAFDAASGDNCQYDFFVSAGLKTPSLSWPQSCRISADTTVAEAARQELDESTVEYNRIVNLIDPLGDDFLKIARDYPWKFALIFNSESAYYGYGWERKGSIFQHMRCKHAVGRLKVKGGGSHKFILHWDGEFYRIEITEMEPDSELGMKLSSFGLAFESKPTNTNR